MQLDTTNISGEVYAENRDKKVMYVKVSIPSLRMYFNSITVRPSTKFDDLWFQLPVWFMGRIPIRPIEFSGEAELLSLIKDEAMRAADRYIQEKKIQSIYPNAKPVGQDEIHDVQF